MLRWFRILLMAGILVMGSLVFTNKMIVPAYAQDEESDEGFDEGGEDDWQNAETDSAVKPEIAKEKALPAKQMDNPAPVVPAMSAPKNELAKKVEKPQPIAVDTKEEMDELGDESELGSFEETPAEKPKGKEQAKEIPIPPQPLKSKIVEKTKKVESEDELLSDEGEVAEEEFLPAVIEEEKQEKKGSKTSGTQEGKNIAEEKKKGSEATGDGEYEEEYWEEETPQTKKEMADIENALEESKKIPNILTNLDDCKRVALLKHPKVQVAIRQMQYERYKVLQAEREFLPAIKGQYEKQEGKSAATGGGAQDFSGLKYSLETQQIVFNSGKLTYALKQARTNLFVAMKKFEQARQEAIFNVEKAYYELVKAQMVFEIQADLSKAAEGALSFSREAYRQGVNTYQEFLNVQSQTDQTYYKLLSSQQDIAKGEFELRRACNIDETIEIQINAVLTFTDFDFNYSLDECLNLGFKNRPDLAVNEYTTLSNLYGIKMSMADQYPKIEFIGNVGKNGQSQKGEAMDMNDEWDVKFQASWVLGANSSQYSLDNKTTVPKKFGATDNTKESKTQSLSLGLFDKIENWANLAKARVDKATAEADLMDLRGTVAKEVQENYFNYQKAMTMVTASLSKIKFLEKDLEINRAKQMMDEVPLSQVLSSELQLGEERVSYVQALADYYTSISGLFKAMGLSK